MYTKKKKIVSVKICICRIVKSNWKYNFMLHESSKMLHSSALDLTGQRPGSQVVCTVFLNKCEGISNISYRGIGVLLGWLRMKQHVVHEQEDARKMNKIYNCILVGYG